LLRGVGGPTTKSAALLSVSSDASSSVAQPGVIERVSACPSPRKGGGNGGTPTGRLRTALLNPPHATQSTRVTSQQTAPPVGSIPALRPVSIRSGVGETAVSPIRIVRWFSPLATLSVNVYVSRFPKAS
jgi:hypothetical protein